jgi:hypothetical protein
MSDTGEDHESVGHPPRADSPVNSEHSRAASESEVESAILRELRQLGLCMEVLEQRSSPALDRRSDSTPTSAVRRPPSHGQINLEREDELQEMNLGAASFARTPTPRKKTSFSRKPQGGPRKSLGAALGGLIGNVLTDTDSNSDDDSKDSQYQPDVFQNLPRSRRSTELVTNRPTKHKTSNLEAAIHNGVVFMSAPESVSNISLDYLTVSAVFRFMLMLSEYAARNHQRPPVAPRVAPDVRR